MYVIEYYTQETKLTGFSTGISEFASTTKFNQGGHGRRLWTQTTGSDQLQTPSFSTRSKTFKLCLKIYAPAFIEAYAIEVI